MGQQNIPRQGEIYKHFKNNLYQIIAIAKHTETEEDMVVYQALYGKFKIYVRPLEQFMNKVDDQTYRFELVDINQLEEDSIQKQSINIDVISKQSTFQHNRITSEKPESQENSEHIEKIVMEPILDNESLSESQNELIQFLDANTCQEKLNILVGLKNRLDNTMLNNMMVSLDLAVSDGTFEDHFEELKDYLQTRMRFEFNRLR